MSITIFEPAGEKIVLSDSYTEILLRTMTGNADPRVSACVNCGSAVIASEPFNDVLDIVSVNFPGESETTNALIDFVEASESVHLYIWEENDCAHLLWRDPLASEWSEVTGEKRLR